MKIENNKNVFSKIKKREDFPILIKQMGYKKLCEVGVNAGYFLAHLATTIPEHLVGVDVWDKYDIEAYEQFPSYYHIYNHENNKKSREAIQSWASKINFNVEIVVDFSVRAAKQFKDGYFDFVYIDADHSYDGVTADLEAWYPKVRKGGMLAGHDYLNFDENSLLVISDRENNCNTKDAIDHFVKKYSKQDDFYVTGEAGIAGDTKSFLIVK